LKNKLAILDLDETLIFGTQKKLDRSEDFKVSEYYVYKRPHLNEFILEIYKHYEIAFWSSAGDEYVQQVTSKIKPKNIEFEFVWSRDKAVYQRNFEEHGDVESHYHYVKPLKKVKKLGYNLSDFLIIDDSPHKCKLNFGNAIYPKAYEGALIDDELCVLSKYLQLIKEKKDFRRIEKRNWKTKMKNYH